MQPRHLIASLLASLAVSSLGPAVRHAHAQVDTPSVRVEKPDIVVRSRPSTKSEVVAPAPAGTELFVMDREENWLWVLLPADINGTRRPGWIRSADLGAPGENSAPTPESKKERNAKKRAETNESPEAQSQQLAEKGRPKQEQVAESRRLKQEQAAASRQAKREADAERRLKVQQAAEERRLQKQQVLADRRTKQQQAEEDRRLERAKRELEKAKQEFDKVAKSDSSEPSKPR